MYGVHYEECTVCIILGGKIMAKIRLVVALVMCATAQMMTSSYAEEPAPFAPNVVDASTGAIRVPEGYRLWPTLGTWAHANTDNVLETKGPGLHEYHVVYTQPETIAYYRKTGRFPDGAVLVKELLNASTMAMTTGPAVGHATTTKGWFVLVRDTKGRYKDSPLWGEGWGWSFFTADDAVRTASKNFKVDCVGCHVPAKQLAPVGTLEEDKWIYTLGYPVLRKK
ncbi:MAG: Putative Cytochrome P460 [Nitrospira sp.]|nr:MAG: Putative Cytochrome P460 [Nitrospira sp.]